MLKNKKSRDIYFNEADTELMSLTKYCEWKNCEKKGEYKAPTSRSELRVFKWFCLDHVKLYNKGWDYFKGRTSDQIYKEISGDSTWHRPTWFRLNKQKFSDLHGILDDKEKNHSFENKKLDVKVEKDIVLASSEILNVHMPIKIADLKKQYKKMVKKFHPDLNKNNNNKEDFIKLHNAYHILLKFLKY